jgi:hypothetical protein
MSIPLICAALEKKLALLLPALPTAFENVTFKPITGTAYQRVNHLINKPVDHAVTADVVEQRGLLQVTLCYPAGAGRGAAQARAQAIAEHFAPVQQIKESSITVTIDQTPQIAGGMADGDFWCIPVTVAWRVFTD